MQKFLLNFRKTSQTYDTDIRNQSKTKIKHITYQLERLVEKEKKEGKDFFRKNHKHFRY